MHLVYSALTATNNQQNNSGQPNHEQRLRYQAYQTACAKYSKEIAAIQKYLPGWMPKFR